MDGNGKPDLLVANWVTNSVGVLLGNGDGTFQPAVTYSSGGLYPMAVVATDLNGDGKPDLVVRNECAVNGCGSGSVGVLLNNTTEGKSATTTFLASSLNPSIYGQKVTWTATVASSGSVTPTGTIKFTWNGNTIGSATLNSSGVATLIRSNLIAATYTAEGCVRRRRRQSGQHVHYREPGGIGDDEQGHAHFVAEPFHTRSGGNVHRQDDVADGDTNRTSYIHRWNDRTRYSSTGRR